MHSGALNIAPGVLAEARLVQVPRSKEPMQLAVVSPSQAL